MTQVLERRSNNYEVVSLIPGSGRVFLSKAHFFMPVVKLSCIVTDGKLYQFRQPVTVNLL